MLDNGHVAAHHRKYFTAHHRRKTFSLLVAAYFKLTAFTQAFAGIQESSVLDLCPGEGAPCF